MDVRLQNAYVEVLLNNFIEVVKQNLLLQAQHEVNKNGFKEAEYSVEKFKEISDNNIVYQNKLTENDSTINQLNSRVNQLITERDDVKLLSAKNYTDKQEKDRLQSAVNDYMRQLKTAQEELLLIKNESLSDKLEKNKLQTVVNDYMSQLKTVQEELSSFKNVSQELNVQKDKLQTVVNDYMSQLKTAQEELLSFKNASQDVLLQNNNRIEELSRHIIKLESVSSVNKIKKVKPGEISQLNLQENAVEIKLPMEYSTNDIVEAGGTF